MIIELKTTKNQNSKQITPNQKIIILNFKSKRNVHFHIYSLTAPPSA